MNGVSIVICCYNSADRIVDTLSFLKNQKVKIIYEVIIVDNNCSDNTIKKATDYWSSCHINLKIIKQLKSGLIYARELGLQIASHDIIIFCDDDNWLEEYYVQTVYDLFESYPTAGAIGGRSTVAVGNGVSLPSNFNQLQNKFAIGEQFEKSGFLKNKLYLWGAGLSVRKKLLEKCFDSDFPFLLIGRNATVQTAGDDTEICYRILILGYELMYDDRLVFKHYIEESRLTESYILKLNSGFSRSFGIQALYSEFIKAVILDKRSKSIVLLEYIFKTPFEIRKIGRLLFWVLGITIYTNDDMRMIRRFYQKYLLQ